MMDELKLSDGRCPDLGAARLVIPRQHRVILAIRGPKIAMPPVERRCRVSQTQIDIVEKLRDLKAEIKGVARLPDPGPGGW